MTFALHPRLAADTLPLGELALSRVLLMNDARFPWLILVPRKPDLREMFELTPADQAALTIEMATAGRTLQAMTGANKMNIGAIGNVVAQLHIHIVARFATDAAWPAPVWGFGRAEPYDPSAAHTLSIQLIAALGLSPTTDAP